MVIVKNCSVLDLLAKADTTPRTIELHVSNGQWPERRGTLKLEEIEVNAKYARDSPGFKYIGFGQTQRNSGEITTPEEVYRLATEFGGAEEIRLILGSKIG